MSTVTADPASPELVDSSAAVARLRDSPLYNDDLAPVPPSVRQWGLASFAALWISMAACIPTYMLASGLIGNGMNWSQAVGTIFLGNVIVVIPMILNAHADSGDLPPLLMQLYDYAWFTGFAIAFVVYLALRRLAPHR